MLLTPSPCHKLSHLLGPPRAWRTLWTATDDDDDDDDNDDDDDDMGRYRDRLSSTAFEINALDLLL